MKKIKLKRGKMDDESGSILFIIVLVKLIIGVIFLIPPILGAFFFTLYY